jgi:hypothetical protein
VPHRGAQQLFHLARFRLNRLPTATAAAIAAASVVVVVVVQLVCHCRCRQVRERCSVQAHAGPRGGPALQRLDVPGIVKQGQARVGFGAAPLFQLEHAQSTVGKRGHRPLIVKKMVKAEDEEMNSICTRDEAC